MDISNVLAVNKTFCTKYIEKYIEPFLSEFQIDLEENKNESPNSLDVWFKFWSLKGDEIINCTWKSKYKDYLLENSTETNSADSEEILNNAEGGEDDSDKSPSIENIFTILNRLSLDETTYNSDQNTEIYSEENVDGWQILWDKHCKQQYVTNFQIFNNIYIDLEEKINQKLIDEETLSLDCEILDYEEVKSQAESNSDQDSDEDENEIMKKMGLPVAFGKRKNEKQKDKLKVQKFLNDLPGKGNGKKNESEIAEQQRSILQKNISAPPEILADKTLLKYWIKRFSLFSRFDEGIKLDKESWFSVTPEKIATQIAKRLSCDIIVDAFCGCGGNTIQFALTCKKVIAIDIDPEKIQFAKHNAKLYGVENRIEFILANFFDICENLKANTVFLSPPWGGPKYKLKESYDIEKDLLPMPASDLLKRAREISKNIAIYLPRNSNLEQIRISAGMGNKVQVQRNYLSGREVALTAYYGDLINP